MSFYIKPVSDIFIKYLFGIEENKDLLLSFINAVLEDSGFQKIVTVELKNPFNIGTFVADKDSILDIKATDEKGRQYDIEVQASGDESFKNRSLYYWSKLYSSQLNKSELYTRLKPAICINILDFILFEEIDYLHTCFLLREEKDPEYILTDHLEIHFLEINKMQDKTLKEKLLHWINYFKNEGKEEANMTILIKDDPDINKAHQVYKHFTEDDKMRELYESREKWLKDYNTRLYTAKQEGIKEGIKEDKLETAKKMLQKGFDVKIISEITELSIEEINKLKKEN